MTPRRPVAPLLVLIALSGGGAACSASASSEPPADGPLTDAGGTGRADGGGAAGSGGASGSTGGTAGTGGSVAGTGGGLFTTGGATGSGGSPATGGSSGSGAGGSAGGAACSPAPDVAAPAETCGNGLDDNLNGFVDENCTCSLGSAQECFDGPPSLAVAANCHKGSQTCSGTAEFPAWGPCTGSGCDQITKTEICNNGTDDDCDGLKDEGCYFDLAIAIDGDCIGIPCPPQAPNPVGCDIVMEGGDSRGCIAHAAGNPAVYFKEGNACPILPGIGGAGHISGTMKCSTDPTPVTLDASNCAINKPTPIYTDNPGGCPQ